jgi:hypothetical protein
MGIREFLRAGIVLAFVTASSANAAEQRVAIGTGGTAGLFYIVGAGMADVINRHLEGVTARAEVTGASVENVRRVAAGQEQLGFSSSSTLFEASVGKKPFTAAQPVAAVAYLYPAVLQIASLGNKNIKTMDDLKSATINLGPPGSNSAVLAQRLLAAYGVFDASRARFLSYAEGTTAMLNGTIDATVALAGAPTAAMIDLATQRDVLFLSVEEKRVANLMKEYPFYQIETIPAGTYRGQNAPLTVINDPAVLFTGKDVDEKLVYDITKTIFNHLDEIGAIHVQAKKILLETATKTPIGLHPGAKRFFDEKAGPKTK